MTRLAPTGAVGAVLVLQSTNAKLGRAAATYLPLTTCPESCALRGSGCYAEGGKVAITAGRLAAEGGDPNAAEVLAIVAARPSPGLPLRLHVSGDVRTPAQARRLAVAAELWRANGGGVVWTYTHAWRDIPRDAWGVISALASCETEADAREARARGYVPALVVREHPADGRARRGVIPCPAQTRDVVCSECRLCMDDRALARRGASIAFAVHGSARRRALAVIQ